MFFTCSFQKIGTLLLLGLYHVFVKKILVCYPSFCVFLFFLFIHAGSTSKSVFLVCVHCFVFSSLLSCSFPAYRHCSPHAQRHHSGHSRKAVQSVVPCIIQPMVELSSPSRSPPSSSTSFKPPSSSPNQSALLSFPS